MVLKEKVQQFILEEFPNDIHEKEGELYLKHMKISCEEEELYDIVLTIRHRKIHIINFEKQKDTITYMIQSEILCLIVLDEIYKMDNRAFFLSKGGYQKYNGELFFEKQFYDFKIEFDRTKELWGATISIDGNYESAPSMDGSNMEQEIQQKLIPSIKKIFRAHKLKGLFKKQKNNKNIESHWFFNIFQLYPYLDYEIIFDDIDFKDLQKAFFEMLQKNSPGAMPIINKIMPQSEFKLLENIEIITSGHKYIVKKINQVKEVL